MPPLFTFLLLLAASPRAASGFASPIGTSLSTATKDSFSARLANFQDARGTCSSSVHRHPSRDSPSTSAAADSTTVLRSSIGWMPPSPSQATVEVQSHADWLELLEEHAQAQREQGQSSSLDDDSITVVKFHAAWCKSCQKFGRLWTHKIARKFQKCLSFDNNKRADDIQDLQDINEDQDDEDQRYLHGLKLASVEFSANSKLCESLGIKQVPTVQFYSHGRLLSTISCGPSDFDRVVGLTKYFLQATDDELDMEASLESMSENAAWNDPTVDISGENGDVKALP